MFEKISDEEKPQEDNVNDSGSKKPFAEAKLVFIEPKLTKHGDATKVTQGFFGGFSP